MLEEVRTLLSFLNNAPKVPDWFKHQSPKDRPQCPVNKNATRLDELQGAMDAAEIQWHELAAAHKDKCNRDGVEWTHGDAHLPVVAAQNAFAKASEEYTSAFAEARKQYEPLYEEYERALSKWNDDDRMARLVQWRFAYAKAMVDQLTTVLAALNQQKQPR